MSSEPPNQWMPPPAPGPASVAPLSPSDERTWAMLAHLSVLANLATGFLGPVIALVIYMVYKDRSRYVAYQSMQAFVFQLIAWVGGGVLVGLPGRSAASSRQCLSVCSVCRLRAC